MAKSLNPMEAYRREQKKKELKKHRQERQKDKQAKLAQMDPTALREQLRQLERQVNVNPADGPTRKRKQELEDTLRAVVKKQKEMKEELKKKEAPSSLQQLQEANREKFQNPENSIYYHPTLNPFGAPPPGMPQVYRSMPPPPRGVAPLKQTGQRHRAPPPRQEGLRGPPRPSGPIEMVRRPGKRPPLPSGPPPPGTIQVPPRPPRPSGSIPLRPPPPPPARPQTAGGMVPPSPPPQPTINRGVVPLPPPPPPMIAAAEQDAELAEEDDSVVAPYPTTDEPDPRTQEEIEADEEAAERAAESEAQLRSLVPVALRVQRKTPVARSSNGATVVIGAPPSVPAPRRPVPAPIAPVPRPAMPMVRPPPPPPRPSTKPAEATEGSVSREFDAFMEEVKDLL